VVAASAKGVVSGAVQIHVVWKGAAKAAPFKFTPPVAVNPGTDLGDSIRVQVTNLSGGPATGARVRFAVTAGGGAVSPAGPTLVTVAGPAGTAAAKWTFGPNPGVNTVTATVVGDDSTLINWVAGNPVSFNVTTYTALSIVQGDAQTGNLLSPLPVAPAVKLVDASGNPRAGVPITFTATNNGRIANSVVSTSVDGIANPGVWTLGDAAGDQQLIATVESAKIVFHATARGTAVHFVASNIATAQSATCAQTSDQFVSCMGQPPQIGTGDSTASQSTPTLTKGGIHFTSIAGGGAHFCGTSSDLSIYCWGVNALADTLNGLGPGGTSVGTAVPTRLQSNLAWLQVTPGAQHNCGLANDRVAYCWGSDTSGQLGDNNVTRHLAPRPVSGGFKFQTLAAGASHECGITLDALAFCWGLNTSGQIGDGSTTNRLTPTAVSGGFKWRAIGAGSNWSCGITSDGQAACWGANTTNQIPVPYSTPAFSSLSVGAAHACALTGDGTAYCWGDNSSGQLGDSTTTSRATPTLVSTTLRFVSISAGVQHTCGITTDGSVACWGRNQFGEIGVSTPLVQLTPRFVVLGVNP